MLKLNIKNADGSLYGYMELKNQEALDAYLVECQAAASYWTLEASGCYTEVEDLGNAPLLKEIRTKRNALLSACDWTQLSDAPEEKKADWAAYRQALRDLPNQPNFDPENVNWPVAP